MGDSETRNMQSSCQTKINSVTCASCWDLYARILVLLFCLHLNESLLLDEKGTYRSAGTAGQVEVTL